MSWHFSRALVAEYSGANSSGGGLSALSKIMAMPAMYCWPGKMMGVCRRSRSGMMCGRLTGFHGADVLMWCREDSRVRTSARREAAQVSRGRKVASGARWRGLLARFDRVSCSWKIPQLSLLEVSDVFSETWPTWGMMRDGVCWALIKPGHLINGIASGFERKWPTIRATDATRQDCASERRRNNPSLVAMVKMFPTPTANDAKNCGGKSQLRRNTKPLNAVIGGALNPTWCEWLMGWPLGWTDCAVSAMDKFRAWRLSHGGF